jgi:L-amino acid N-acyltransferase YncA
MKTIIRLAAEEDSGQVQAIYGPIVSQMTTSFEFEPPSAEEMRRRIADTLAHLPWLVCDRDGEVLGYAYASPHRSRAAYQWSVDVSVYIHSEQRHSGIGRALYRSLFEILVMQGYYNAYAGIALPNPASVGLHEAVGFRSVGVYQEVGYKLGAWHDVGWWQLALQPKVIPPQPTRDLRTIRQSQEWTSALSAGETLLRV